MRIHHDHTAKTETNVALDHDPAEAHYVAHS